MRDTNVVFEVGVSKDETFFEQVYIYIYLYLYILKLIRNKLWFLFLFAICTPQANLFGNYVCKCKFKGNCHTFTHSMCHWKKEKTFYFGGQSMKDNFQIVQFG
jgi:hypothetical protein